MLSLCVCVCVSVTVHGMSTTETSRKPFTLHNIIIMIVIISLLHKYMCIHTLIIREITILIMIEIGFMATCTRSFHNSIGLISHVHVGNSFIELVSCQQPASSPGPPSFSAILWEALRSLEGLETGLIYSLHVATLHLALYM